MNMYRPYVGITGFMSAFEVRAVLDAIPLNLWKGYQLMAGILVSTKTLRGQGNSRPGRYPKINKLSEILFPDPRVLWLIHFYSEDPTLLLPELKEVTECAGDHCHGVQLNMAWPLPFDVCEYRRWLSERQAHPRVVLQIGRRAMELVSHDPSALAACVSNYVASGDITDVLIDPSGGTGSPFDPNMAADYLLAIQRCCPHTRLGVAGGLSADTMDLLRVPLEAVGTISCDVEGKVRDASDNLNLEAAIAYTIRALKMLNGNGTV